MGEYYKFVADEDELKWFFDHVVERPELDESYMLCLSARNKKLTEDERVIYQLGRGEMMREEIIAPRSKSKLWDYNIFRSAVYRYECRKEGMVTKNGKDYPDKCLVVYFYPNPSKESLVVSDSVQLAITMMSEMINAAAKKSWEGVVDGLDKLGTVSRHLKSSHAVNLSRKVYVQYDFDLPSDLKTNEDARKYIIELLHEEGIFHFGKQGFFIVETSGGYHVLVKKTALSKGMERANKLRKEQKLKVMPDYLYTVSSKCKYLFDEAVKCDQEFLPLPGTYQYGSFPVKIVNKDDFEGVD